MKRKTVYFLPILLAFLFVGCNTDDGVAEQFGYNYGLMDAYEGNMILPEQGGDQFDEFTDNPFVKVVDVPVSTFSVDADGAAYAIMRRYANSGYEIDPSSVRIEEYLNYFTFDYPAPIDDNTVAINAEVGECPWNAEHRLLRLGLKGKELKSSEVPQANYVFLVDVSGSMDSSDKLELLKKGLITMLGQLNPEDRISLITYSGKVKKVLESTPVKKADKIKKAIKSLTADGSTAGGAALRMAYEEASANYNPKYNNRVIMGTDGDFNVGVTNVDSLVSMVERYASKGIYMTCLGFGYGNLNDGMMEKVSNAGNGTYYYIDSENEMMKVFVHERERFISVANDTKCQVSFDSTMVSEYRLIGYENRLLSQEDFENDKKDAGEIGAGQTITALYEIVPTNKFDECIKEQSSQRHVLATFDCRYKKSLNASSIPLTVEVSVEDMYDSNMKLLPASENLNFAAGVAAYGMVLRKSPYKGDANIKMASDLVRKSCSFDPHGYRSELLDIMQKIKVKE